MNPSWLYARWQGTPYTKVFGVAMLPEQVSGVSLAKCSQGSYNAYWRRFASVIKSYGLDDSIIRLGWEFNGDWYVWAASDPVAWQRCWRKIVTTAEGVAPRLRWEWAVNRGQSAGLADPTLAWPGDAYVDVVGVDSYDMWPPATSDSGWATQQDGPQGLRHWLRFASSHGKKLSVPEWGNVLATYGGGDNQAYISRMFSFFQDNAASIAYESLFQAGLSSFTLNAPALDSAATTYATLY